MRDVISYYENEVNVVATSYKLYLDLLALTNQSVKIYMKTFR